MIRRFLSLTFAACLFVAPQFVAAADLTITAASVSNSGSANTNTGTAGGTLSAGMAVYVDTATSTIKACDATSATAYKAVGITLHASLTGQPITYATGGGSINLGATLSVGTTLFVSKTGSGLIMPTADLASTNHIFRLGYCTSASVFQLDFKDYGVSVP